MVRLRPVLYLSGILLLALAGAMFAPLVADLAGNSADWKVFASAQVFTCFIAFLLIFTNREESFRLSVRETFLATATVWVVLSAFGALPFCFSSLRLTAAQGFFEAISGMTTTGMTAVTGLESRPPGILLWRAMLHWLGGITGLISALAILPLLQVSGQQVFRAQSLDEAKILPRTSQTAAWTFLIYTGLTLICAFLLKKAADMGTLDALCHAMTALSTGGFSTSGASVARFDSLSAEIILMLFMLIGSLPFTLYLRMAQNRRVSVLKDGQARFFLAAAALFVWVLTLCLVSLGLPFGEALRRGAFRAVALITTSGLTLNDDALWGPVAGLLFLVITFIGGCSGSTTGGVRVFRVQILFSMLRLQIRKLIEPNGIFQVYYNGKTVDAEVLNAIVVFLIAHLLTVTAGGVLLMLADISPAQAFLSAFAAVSNASTALGTAGTPLPLFAALPQAPLWILSACMLLGRVEIFTLLVLLAPRFWRR